MAMTNSTTLLGCGRDIDAVWAGIERPPTEHERTCVHCTAAREDLLPLATATEELRRRDDSDPDLQPSPALADRILGLARSEVRRGRRLPLDPPGADRTSAATVSSQAVATVVRRVGDRTSDVQIRRVQLAPEVLTPTPPGSEPTLALDDPNGVDRARVAVTLRVSVGARTDIPRVVDGLRHAVIEAVVQEIGLDVTSVDVTVEDLHD